MVRNYKWSSQPSGKAAGITEAFPRATAKPPDPVDLKEQHLGAGGLGALGDGQDGVGGA